MSNDNSIGNSLATTSNTLQKVKSSLDDIFGKMNHGEKIVLSDLIDKVASSTGIKISIVNGVVPMLLEDYPGIAKERGRAGGIFKGEKIKSVDRRPRCPTCHQVVRQMQGMAKPSEKSEDLMNMSINDISEDVK